MWRRPIIPLTDDERDNHLFRIPDDVKRFDVLPQLSSLKESFQERSMTQPEMSSSKLGLEWGTAQPHVSRLTLPGSTLRMTSEPASHASQLDTTVTQSITPLKSMQAVS